MSQLVFRALNALFACLYRDSQFSGNIQHCVLIQNKHFQQFEILCPDQVGVCELKIYILSRRSGDQFFIRKHGHHEIIELCLAFSNVLYDIFQRIDQPSFCILTGKQAVNLHASNAECVLHRFFGKLGIPQCAVCIGTEQRVHFIIQLLDQRLLFTAQLQLLQPHPLVKSYF